MGAFVMGAFASDGFFVGALAATVTAGFLAGVVFTGAFTDDFDAVLAVAAAGFAALATLLVVLAGAFLAALGAAALGAQTLDCDLFFWAISVVSLFELEPGYRPTRQLREHAPDHPAAKKPRREALAPPWRLVCIAHNRTHAALGSMPVRDALAKLLKSSHRANRPNRQPTEGH